MRIIAGAAKGRSIQAPKGDATRPTLDRVKESLFSIIQFSIAGARVLDLYAGSGNLALEALSRGAAYAVCNDHDALCCKVIKRNIESLGFTAQAEVLHMDALAAIRRMEGSTLPFDIVFLDPPYQQNVGAALQTLFEANLVALDGKVIVEHNWSQPPDAVQDRGMRSRMRLTDQRKYGDTGLSFFERTSPA